MILKVLVRLPSVFVRLFRGEEGIRTPGTLLEFTRFPSVPLKPLEHLSVCVVQR